MIVQSTSSQSTSNQIVTPGRMLRVESLAIVAGALALYAASDFSWLWLVVLLLTPDLSMLGYLFGTRIGAITYNAAHTYSAPIALGAIALLTGWSIGVMLALIWIVHIALDRLLGYGLKYGDHFKHTHLGQV